MDFIILLLAFMNKHRHYIYNNRRITQEMIKKKNILIPQIQRPKRALTLCRQIKDITNEGNIDLIGLKGTSITKKEEIRMHICKPHHLEIKKSVKKISIRVIQEIQENKTLAISSREKIDHDQNETLRRPRQISIDLKNKKSSSQFGPRNESKSLLNVEIDQHKQQFFQFYQVLKHQNYISSSNSLLLTMKHQKFHDIVKRIIMLSINTCKIKEKKLDPIQKSIYKLKDHYLNNPHQSQEKNLQIVNNLNVYQYNPSRYRYISAAHVHKIQVLREQIANLQQLISQKYQQLTHVTTSLSEKTKLTQNHELKLYEIRQQIARQEERINQITAKSFEFEVNLREIEQRYKDAVRFVSNQQKRKILQQVSKQYKQIESDIYEYAVYLQCNQLANDINYEPHPFTEIERHINYELKEIISDITKNTEKTFAQKCIQMKEFVQGSMSTFKKKDIEMQKLNEFRTKCIVNFIEKMKKWLDNWQLKQEYLTNLKKQFVGICIILKQDINCNISKHFQQISPENIRNQYRKMLKTVQQLELNFNHGNSFY